MVRIKRSTLYSDGYVVKEMAKVGVTTHNSTREITSDPPAHPLLAFVNRTGSGFFSSLSALPAIFSMSTTASTPPTASTSTNSTASATSTNLNESLGTEATQSATTTNGDLNDTSNRPPTPMPTSVLDQAVAPNKITASPPSKGIDRTDSGTSLANGASGNFGSENGREEGPPFSSLTSNHGGSLEVDSFYDMKGSTSPSSANKAPAVPLCNDTSASIDVQFFLKLNSYLKIIEDQVRKPSLKKQFDQGLESYAPYALAEFNQHLARYYQWELKNEEPPRLLSLPFLRMGEG